MSNVLNDDKRNQVVALGQMGWSLRQIQKATGVRRETAAGYLKAAGIAVFGPGRRGNKPQPDSRAAIPVTTDSKAKSDSAAEPADSKPAIEVTTDFGRTSEALSTTLSACEPYRELIEQGLSHGRNAMSIWQQLVDQHGFTGAYESVKRFIRKQRGSAATSNARAANNTPPKTPSMPSFPSPTPWLCMRPPLCLKASVGLDPYLGFLHQMDHGRVSLALDVMEPFRAPVADRLVLKLFNKRVIQAQDFERRSERSGVFLTPAAMVRFFEAYEKWMTFTVDGRPSYRAVLKGCCERLMIALRDKGEYQAFSIDEAGEAWNTSSVTI